MENMEGKAMEGMMGEGITVSHRDTEETEEAGQARLYTEKRIRVCII